MKDIKTKPNRNLYIDILKKMSPAQRLNKAFELSEMTKSLFKAGLKQRFPEKSQEDLHALFLKRLQKCYNQNY